MAVAVGTAPDSWGVWFADDPNQPPWHRFLDEVVAAGYETIELGPYGYLPTDPRRLRAELEQRSLRLSAGLAMPEIHRPERWGAMLDDVARVCDLVESVGAGYLVLIPNLYTDLYTGRQVAEAELDDENWKKLIEGTHLIAEQVRADTRLRLVFHPHAETPVEYEHQIARFLDDTDADLVALCLDLGHHAYRGGDAVEFFAAHHERIEYLHLKSVDAQVRAHVMRDGIPFAQAAAMDVFVEPSDGVIDFRQLGSIIERVGYDGYGIVEQDLYPTTMDRPLPIARRTRSYLRDIGLG